MKKTLSIILSILIAISVMPLYSITSFADAAGFDYGDPVIFPFEYTYVYDNYGYNILDGGTIEIAQYLGTEENEAVVVPTKIDGKKVTAIGYGAFEGSKIASVIIGDEITTIGEYAFSYCRLLTSVTIGNGVTSIKDGAFHKSVNLSSLEIGSNVSSIGNGVFMYCYGLSNITVDDNNKNYSSDEYGVLFNKDKTELIQYPIGNTRKNYTIPNDVTEIGYGSFGFCNNIISVDIPTGVTKIDDFAFYKCSGLTSIAIPKSVTSIGYAAFLLGTNDIKDVYYTGTEEEWNSIVVDENNSNLLNATIHFNYVTETSKKITDKNTGIEFEYPAEAYDGEIELQVEEIFDGSSFQIVETIDNVKYSSVFDITTTVDGVEVQPKTPVTVRIPLPENYDPNITYVYHINSETRTVENMNARYENGYLVFETTHFSHYAVVQIGEDIDCNVSIQAPSRTTIRCKDGIKLHANVEGTLPEGAKVVWSTSNSNFTEKQIDDNTFQIVSKNNGYTTVTVSIVDADGNVLATDSVEMRSKAGFGDKIGGFFRSLFGATKIYDN